MDDGDPSVEYLDKLNAFLSGEDPGKTGHQALAERGWVPPEPTSISDEDMPRALTDLLWALYDLGVVVDDGEHLSDRELYSEIFEWMKESNVFFPDDPDTTLHFSPIGGFSEEDIHVWMRYYADPETRDMWASTYPDDELPPAELPPYRRSWLPQRQGPLSD